MTSTDTSDIPSTTLESTSTARAGVSVMRRVFRMGPTDLVDLAPTLPPEDSLKYYETVYPILKQSTLGPPFEEDGVLVYPVLKPPVQVKGAR